MSAKHELPSDSDPQKLPADSCSWAAAEEEEGMDDSMAVYGEHPPLLDMANMRYDYFQEEFAWACREWGLFYAVNHGVNEDLISLMEEEGKRFFSLPLDVKLQAHRAPGTLSGYGKPSVSHELNTLLCSECFTYCRDNQNLEHEYHPHHFINRHLFREYDEALYGLALKLLRLFSLSLGIDMTEVDWMREGGELGFVHMNHYPPCPKPSKAMGLPPHTDSSLFTIIHQRKNGLQIIRDNRWIDIPPLHNTFVVQLGDMLQIVSNDRYKSPVHRAVVKKDDWRLSIAYFLAPPPSTKVKPCVSLCRREAPSYGDVSWQQVVEAKPKHPQGTLDIFRLV